MDVFSATTSLIAIGVPLFLSLLALLIPKAN
jgi:hypothetical protein